MGCVIPIVMRMKTSDQALAKAAADGDRDAFSVLLERRYDGIFRLAFRLTGNRNEAEDLTQDICASLPEKLAAYRAEAQFSTWLYRVVVNGAHDRRRRAATRTKAADGWGSWEVNRRATDQEVAQNVDWLTHAMASLTSDLRDTLALLMDDEMTQAQAAIVLGVSEGTVSWRVSEAKKSLRLLAQKEAAQ